MIDRMNSLLWSGWHVQVWFYARAKDASGPYTYQTNAWSVGDAARRSLRGETIWLKVK